MFTHDVALGLDAAADLVNTRPEASASGRDELTTMAELDAYVTRQVVTGSRRRSATELAAVRELRTRIDALWAAEDDGEAVAIVNRMLLDGRALPQLVDHDGIGLHIHAARPESALADRMTVEFAMAWLDVLRQGEHARLKRCAADDCDAVLVDLSRNRSKRFCDVGNCGNRMNVRAFRARAAGT